ncbi:GAF domain-containing sensor histidine kinase [Ferruginibacter sp.]
MIIAELPIDEDLRLQDLASYELMDTQAENEFDELVELAGQICKSPISLISLLDKDRQWFKSRKGLEDTETSRDVAFCAHAILQDDVMKVEDATKDVRFFDNPLVADGLKIRFYAGAPIVSPTGHKLGTLCVIDTTPRELSPEQERALTILSNQVTKLLELRKKNMVIRKRAEEMIAMKSSVISRVIEKQEEDRKAIATSLHEDFAQSVASSIMYLKMAQESNKQSEPFLQTAQQQLNEVLGNMRNLSYSIVPATLNWLPAEELVREFVEKTADTFPFKVKFKMVGNPTMGAPDKALTIIRIIENWLKVLFDKKAVTKVNITLHTEGRFEVLIEDNGPVNDFENGRKDIFDSLLYDRIKPHAGVVDLSVSPAGKNILKIMLPVTAIAV